MIMKKLNDHEQEIILLHHDYWEQIYRDFQLMQPKQHHSRSQFHS